MLILLLMSTISLMISCIFIILSLIISKKSFKDREKCSPFECGFAPLSSPRAPFSLHFFLITVIFLIFDIEIALILPMIISFKMTNLLIWWSTSTFFIFILLIGLYHEWNQNMINWTI